MPNVLLAGGPRTFDISNEDEDDVELKKDIGEEHKN